MTDLKTMIEHEIQMVERDVKLTEHKICHATQYAVQTGLVARYEEELCFLSKKRELLADALDSICKIDDIEVTIGQ